MSQAADPALPGEQRGVDVDAEHLRALLADTADLAAVLDAEGHLRYLNRAGRRLLVLSSELVARPLTDVHETLGRLRTILILIGIAGIGGAALLGLLVARSALQPVRRLRDHPARWPNRPEASVVSIM